MKRRQFHATVLIADLRGFSQMCEEAPFKEVLKTLNAYFTEMTRVIISNTGYIDKFMGDSILAVFGIEKHFSATEEHAVNCAIQMQRSLGRLNDERQAQKLPRLSMGIGIASGKVIRANVGSKLHTENTVIGKPVNLAAHLQAWASDGILTTHNVVDKVEHFVHFAKLNKVLVKGINEKVELLAIYGYKF